MERADMRAGDGDRETVATQLKAALDDGRLDLHEYDERLQRAYSAKTYGELQSLTTDLPGTVPLERSQVQPVSPQAPGEQPAQSDGGKPTWLLPYAGLIAVTVAIWAISSIASGDLLYFWPIWMVIPLIFGVVGQMSGRKSRRDRRRGR